MWEKILTIEHLKKRGFQLARRCLLCGEAKENLNHLLIHCPSVWSPWEGLIYVSGLCWVCPFTVKDLFLEWTSFPVRKKIKNLWMAAPLFFIWAIWKERNRIVFEDMPFSYPRLKAFLYKLVFFLGWFFGFGGGFFCKNFFVHSLSCFCWVGRCFFVAFLFVWLGFFLFTSCISWETEFLFLPFLLIIFAQLLSIKKKEKKKNEHT